MKELLNIDIRNKDAVSALNPYGKATDSESLQSAEELSLSDLTLHRQSGSQYHASAKSGPFRRLKRARKKDIGK